MIRAGGVTGKGGKILILGLSKANCEELLKGRPISFPLKEYGFGENDVVLIMGGETEQAVAAELKKHMTLPDTPRN